ncbi:MAG: PAS domain-containing protein, partial [Planktothrix sp.]|uniref:PAS domain-containing protein n=1 Tax=Planktothrix sp. TaxID=3088171 RepID=UPI0038D3A523
MLNQNLSKNSLTLLSDIPLAIIEWDSDCRIKQWNSQAEKIFGWTAEEAIGQHAFFLIPAHLKPMISDIFSQLYTQTGGLRNLNENLRKDGEIITCEWYNKPFFDEQNQLISIVSLIKDISLETELREQIDAFLSTVAGLASYIDFNLRYEAVNGKMAEYLGLNP